MTNIDTLFTRQGCKAPSFTDAKAMTAKVGPEYAEAEGKLEGVTLLAAYATHAAVVSGYLVDGRTKDPKAGSLDNGKFAALYGRNDGSIVTFWRHLGHAAVVIGVKPESGLWKALCGNHAAKLGAVRKAIMAEKASVTSLSAAVKSAGFNPKTGQRIEKPKPAPANTGARDAASEKDGGGEQTGTNTPIIPAINLKTAMPEVERVLIAASDLMANASQTTREKYAGLLRSHLASVEKRIASGTTPRSNSGQTKGIQVPTPATVAARVAS